MARVCSQCGKELEPGKGCKIHYYRGSKEEAFDCCATPSDCIDKLKAKKAEEGFGRPGV